MAVRSEVYDFGDLLTTTLPDIGADLADNITTSTMLLDYLNRQGNVKPWTGGRGLQEGLEYAFNESFMFYNGYEFLNTSPNEIMTTALFPIKQASIAVSISGLEQRMNRGKAAVIDLLETKINNARRSAKHYFAASVYSDGTGFNGKELLGLSALVSKTPNTGVVGGIDASDATNAWWRNVAINAATAARGPITKDNVQDYFNDMTLQLTRGNDGPNLIVVDNVIWSLYRASLTEMQRIESKTGDGEAGAGFPKLVYYGPGGKMDVVLDGGRGGNMPAKTAYFLNTDYLRLREDPGRRWTVVGGDRMNTNQDAITRLMLWAGGFTVTNRSMQGVLFDTTA